MSLDEIRDPILKQESMNKPLLLKKKQKKNRWGYKPEKKESTSAKICK